MKLYVMGREPGPFKVGVSYNSKLRAESLGKLPVIHSESVPAGENPFELEKRAHAMLARWRVHGEWFSCSSAMAELAIIEATRC